jgi:hypothetical protein
LRIDHAKLAVVPVGRAERVGRPVVPEGRARDHHAFHGEARVAQLGGDGVGGVAAVIVVDRGDLEDMVGVTGFLQHRIGRVLVDRDRRKLRVFGVDRADMVVFRRDALTVDAQVEADLRIDGQRDRARTMTLS